MGRGALVAAWIGSLAPGLLALLLPAGDLGQGSQLGWALVPWIALAGLPAWSAPEFGTRATVTWGLALPPLALAAALDHAADATWATWTTLATVALPGLALIFLLALAAERGRERPLAHGLVWLVLVPGATLCSWSLGLGGAASPGLEFLAQLSPLSWALERASTGVAGTPGELPAALGASLGPLAVAAVCLLATARRRT